MDFEQEFEVIPVTRVKITDTEAYSKHPFRVVHNKALEMLAEDIKEKGAWSVKSNSCACIRFWRQV